MRAAIYARRSKEEQEASLEVQVAQATRYIRSKGWTLDPSHVFLDGETGTASRAEFKKRPGLVALLVAAEKEPVPFDVVVIQRDDRLGGDVFRAGLVVQNLVDSGLRLFNYTTDDEVRLDGAIDKFIVAAKGFGSELEREKISHRTHETLTHKARQGFVAGGKVFGYRNVGVMKGTRRDVEYAIDESEAKIVRHIFERYAAGDGLRAIAKDLNLRGVPSPRAGKRGTGSWAPSTIQPMLRRETYIGLLVWGRRQKTYKGGTKVRVPRPQRDWIVVEAPHLRIIDDGTWTAVHARFGKKLALGRQSGRGAAPKYLLSGVGTCGVCGNRMKVNNRKSGTETIKVYVCGYHRERGSTVCGNSLGRPVKAVDDAVLAKLSESVLTERIVLGVLREVRRRLAEQSLKNKDEIPELEAQARRLRTEIARLIEAVTMTTEPIPTLVLKLAEKERLLKTVEVRIETLQAAPSVFDLEVRRVEREAKARLLDLKNTLRRNPEEAQRTLAQLLDGPLVFTPTETPEGPRYNVSGRANVARLMASPAGFEPA